ncbi:hypothetical protein GW17_00006115 [Ensete ventricosum]|nr:hypothetical protein GW17_00006115 [Ensete ventricosum]
MLGYWYTEHPLLGEDLLSMRHPRLCAVVALALARGRFFSRTRRRNVSPCGGKDRGNLIYISCHRYIASTLFSDNDEVGTTDNPEKSFPIPSKLLGLNPGSGEKVPVKDVEALTLEDAIQLLQYPKTLVNF